MKKNNNNNLPLFWIDNIVLTKKNHPGEIQVKLCFELIKLVDLK